MRYYLAIDIGASSGRHIVGWQENGVIETKEVFRFPNGVHQLDGHLVWDIEGLVKYVKEGIEKAKAEFPQIESAAKDNAMDAASTTDVIFVTVLFILSLLYPLLVCFVLNSV